MEKEIFNDLVLKATLIDSNYVVIEWMTNKIGYLAKTVIKDLYKIEALIKSNKWSGWIMGSEHENKEMHKLIQKFGGNCTTENKDFKFFIKRFNNV